MTCHGIRAVYHIRKNRAFAKTKRPTCNIIPTTQKPRRCKNQSPDCSQTPASCHQAWRCKNQLTICRLFPDKDCIKTPELVEVFSSPASVTFLSRYCHLFPQEIYDLPRYPRISLNRKRGFVEISRRMSGVATAATALLPARGTNRFYSHRSSAHNLNIPKP